FLAHVRAGEVRARGAQGSAAKWAHAAIALAARSLGARAPAAGRAGAGPERPDPQRVLAMVSRLLHEADARPGAATGELPPADARCLLHAWLAAVELDHLDERALIEYMQDDGFDHADLYRRACRQHERKLRAAVTDAVAAIARAGAGEGAGEIG